MKKGIAHILILLVVLVIPLSAAIVFYSQKIRDDRQVGAQSAWAFEETFTGNPTSPSQSLLPKRFDYVVTHRTHPSSPDGTNDGTKPGSFGTFPADHGPDCLGPDPTLPLDKIQHQVDTTHRSNTNNPDESFFVCKDHMMSSMGDVEGYSVATFYPRQEFDYSDGGNLEFDSGISSAPGGRTWWEVNIIPKNELQLGAADSVWPIDETYPKSRIVLKFTAQQTREVQIGVGGIDPDGTLVDKNDWQGWKDEYPDDPASLDRRIRRKHKVALENNKITWSIQKQDGTFDDYVVDIPQGLPFKNGLVLFSQHAYTPMKDGNTHLYTSHWDNIRFDGPVITPFEGYEVEGVLQMAGLPAGGTKTQTINLPRVGNNTYLLGQVHSSVFSEVLLSVNGGPFVTPNFHSAAKGCWGEGWTTFYNKLDPSVLKVGENTLTWKYGPRVNCNGSTDGWPFRSMAVKAVEVHMDSAGGIGGPAPSSQPSASVQPTVVPTPTLRPTPTPVPTPTPPTVVASNTVNFDDKATGTLGGQYPANLIDWGSGKWFLSGPWGQFSTKSISFDTSGVTSETAVFVTPSLIKTIEAYNGGGGSSTVSLACAGNTTKTVTIPANTKTIIATGWNVNCGTVTFSSSNGWDTNFDNLVYESGIAPIVPTPSPTPAPSPTPLQIIPTPTPSSTTRTVTFNDTGITNKTITGQYPTGLIDWGTSNLWFVSSPWKLFTTKSISFNSSSTTQAQFAYVGGPRTLVSLKAFNGGSGVSTITLICAGNSNKVQTVNPGQLLTITTGWATPCSFVRVNSTNGWNTNFDDLVIR